MTTKMAETTALIDRLEANALAQLTQAALDLDLAADRYNAINFAASAARLRQTAAEVRAASGRLSR